MDAQAVAAEMYDYGWKYTASLYIREALARVKDVFANVLHLPASAAGDAVDLHGSGSVTDDAATALWLSEM